jgi:hypothetical protein
MRTPQTVLQMRTLRSGNGPLRLTDEQQQRAQRAVRTTMQSLLDAGSDVTLDILANVLANFCAAQDGPAETLQSIYHLAAIGIITIQNQPTAGSA